MKYTRAIINGVLHDSTQIDTENPNFGVAGEIIVDAKNYRCPRCKKTSFFECPDKEGPILACHNYDCMQRDARILKSIARQKWFAKFIAETRDRD